MEGSSSVSGRILRYMYTLNLNQVYFLGLLDF